MKNKKINIFLKILPFLFFIIFFLVLLIPRYFGIVNGLPDYGVDENAVVGFSIGYMHGDLNPHWFKYGPLYSYLLAIVYFVKWLFSSLDYNDFLKSIFFNPYNFYFIARICNVVLSLFLAFLVYFFSAKNHNKQVAVVALFLAIFPFIENLTRFQVRIDVLLAVWSLLAVFFVLKISQTKKTKYYITTGLFVGLGLATKPITALFVLPTIFLGHYFASKKENYGIKKLIFNKKLLLLFSSSFIFNFIFNPYSLLSIKDFLFQTLGIIINDTGRHFLKGWHLSMFTQDKHLGYVFVLMSLLGVCYYIYKYLKTRKDLYLIIVSYPIVFWFSFAFFPAREYFYIPIIPFLIIMTSKFLIDLSEKIKIESIRYLFILTALILIIWQPSVRLYKKTSFLKEYSNQKNAIATVSAKYWIEENIPKMSKILLYGKTLYLPRLVDYRLEQQMEFSHNFLYDQDENKLYLESYREAFEKYKNEGGIVFDLDNIDKVNGLHKNYNEADLFQYCTENDFDYVLVSFRLSLDEYPEFKRRKFNEFDVDKHPIGFPFEMYKLK